ncbi:MAG TPA: type II secretion system protein, partial [Nannocystaceae bacterium]|nr:type II secretion system protein [Nannocystaceae bacterium]
MAGRRPRYGEGGFTLLEVMIAVAILGISMTSLLTSQMASIRATRYAQALTAVAFLAEYQILEVEWLMEKDGGWVPSDRNYEGTFTDQGWPGIRYKCLVDFLEIPDYSKIRAAKDAKAQAAREKAGGSSVVSRSAGDQAFTALGLVWPMVKAAIEKSIRKVKCTVTWTEGKLSHEMVVTTFWTDPEQLSAIPKMGGEAIPGEEDD